VRPKARSRDGQKYVYTVYVCRRRSADVELCKPESLSRLRSASRAGEKNGAKASLPRDCCSRGKNRLGGANRQSLKFSGVGCDKALALTRARLEGLQHSIGRIDAGQPADRPYKRQDAWLIGPVFAWATIMRGHDSAIYKGRERNLLGLDPLA
jgi:hypothetical protein